MRSIANITINKQFLFMQVDQRFIQNLHNDNAALRQQVTRLTNNCKALQEKYQKSLKEMSSIIHANQNLKQQLDNIKINAKNQVENSIRDIRIGYEKRIEELLREKNDLSIMNQNLLRQKEQNQRDLSSMERSMWEAEALRNEIAALKKENQKLLLQTHPLTQNQENPQSKLIEQKLSQKIQELNKKVAELNVLNTQSKKTAQLSENERQRLEKQVQILKKKNDQLSSALEKANVDNLVKQGQEGTKVVQSKSYQVQVMDLRKRNAELINEVERLKLQKMEMTSQANKNEAEMYLLSTLKSLHSQLEPMRYEIQELKRDKYFERESTNKEKAELHMKLLSCEHQLESLKQYIKDLQTKNRELSQQMRSKQWEKYKFQQLQEEKRILQGRVIVYEAMEMVSKNRDKPQHVQRIQQFERRIHLLLQQQNLQYLVNNANVHQLIAMKAYVIELDNKLQIVLEQNQNLNKKYAQYKEKYQQMTSENKKIINKHYSMVNAYKGKISGYEKLIMKLTEELQRYLKQNQGANLESHYKSVITLYESKILSIHNEVNAKKQQNREILKKVQNLQLELKGKLELIKQLELQINNLKNQNRDLNTKIITRQSEQYSLGSQVSDDHYKTIINQKTKQIIELQDQLSKMRFNIDKMEFDHDRDLENYRHKISRLEIEIQQLRLEQSEANKHLSTSKNSQDIGELMHKISTLEKNIAILSKDDANKNTLLLQNRIIDLEAELSIKQRQLKRYSNQINVNVPYQSNSLQQENIRLKAELDKIKASYRAITQESQGLMMKIRDTQAYIMSLKDDFNAVSIKMTEYQKQISIKDTQIQEWKLKFNSLQQQYETQMWSLKLGSNPIFERQLNERQRRIRNMQEELGRGRWDMDSQIRDIERRQMESRRRQSEIDSKNREIQQRLRKVQEREKMMAQQEMRLIHWSDQLDRKAQNVEESPAKFIKTYSQINTQTNRNELLEWERKVKRLQVELLQKQREVQSKDQRLEKLIRQKAELSRKIEDLNFDFSDKTRYQEHSERQINSLKVEIQRLEGQLSERWKQSDILRQQLKSKEKQMQNFLLDKRQLIFKNDLEIKQLKSTIKQNEQIQRQWEQRIREVQQRTKIKIKQIYKENEENVRELHQTISELTSQLGRYRVQGISENKAQIQSSTAAISSLQAHIVSLEQELQRRQFGIHQLEEEVKYYKDLVEVKEQQLKKIYESTIEPSISHDQCVRKEHLLRMEIERLSSIIQSKGQTRSEKSQKQPQSPRSQYLDNSYLNELEETNKRLEEDLELQRKRLIALFDEKRSIDQFLSIMVITFAEVDALRQRIYELQQNFKEEHERQVTVLTKLDSLKQHETNIQNIQNILRQLQLSHRAFHEEEERSRSTFIKRINNDVLATSEHYTNNIGGLRNITQVPSSIRQESSTYIIGTVGTERVNDGQRSIKYSLQNSSNQGLGLSGQIPAQTYSIHNFSLPTPALNTTGITTNFNYPLPNSGIRDTTYIGSSITQPIGGTTGSMFSSATNQNGPAINRQRFLPGLPSISSPPVSPGIAINPASNIRAQFSPYGRNEKAISPNKPPQVRFGTSSSSITPATPYMMSNNQLLR